MSNNENTEAKKIELSRGAISWIASDTGYSRTYVHDFINDPINWKGSSTAFSKLAKSVEDYRKYEKTEAEKKQRRVNALLSSTKE